MKKELSISIIFLAIAIACNAQDPLKSIDSLLFDSQFDQALVQVETVLKSTSNQNQRVVLENKRAEILIRAGKFEEAERQLESIAADITSFKFAGCHQGKSGLPIPEPR